MPSGAIIRFRCTASACRSAAPRASTRRICARIAEVAARIEPGLVSEHLSWSVVGGTYLADLLPLPMTEEALDVVCRHVEQTQAALKRRILIENPSTYLQFRHSTIPEWEFIAAVAERTGCGILCDVNNIYVSASNHGWDPQTYLNALPAGAVGEIHLAGHALRPLSTAAALAHRRSRLARRRAVWALYAQALRRFGPVPTLIEWDTDIPAFDVLLDEAARPERAARRDRGRAMPTLLELQRWISTAIPRQQLMEAARRHCRRRSAPGERRISTATPASARSSPRCGFRSPRCIAWSARNSSTARHSASSKQNRRKAPISISMARALRISWRDFPRPRRLPISPMSRAWNGR